MAKDEWSGGLISWLGNRRLIVVLMIATAINGVVLTLKSKMSPASHEHRSIEERVAAWAPTHEEKRFQQVPWSSDLEGALAEARRRHRLILAVVSNGDFCTGRL